MPYTARVADEHDAGIDKQKLLDEIVGTSGSFEAVAPPAVPAPPASAARVPLPPPLPLPLPKSLVPAAPPPRASSPVIVPKMEGPPKPLHRFFEFRNEVAAMVLGICGMIWSAIGIATRAWLPGGVGAVLLVLAIGVWALEMLRDE